ncbi:MAG: LytTR family transcriptional regulator [Oscillospiraceae bacterium]|nr:LytTR family transcriptional regulator [Oscillospiraceae bacterium]
MKPYLLYSPSKNELSLLASVMNFLMKKRGTVQIPDCVQRLEKLEGYLENPSQLQMMVCDVTTGGVLPVLEKLRRSNADMKLVLVADGSVSPVQYIRPSILPTALLWRPLQPEGARDTLWEVLSTVAVETQEEEASSDQYFTMEVRGEVRRIPYKEILFFEASNKRLNLHLARKEIPFPGTLEKLAEELPEGFIRIHKSFIVNRNAINQIQYGQNLVILEGGVMVPISRSYKSALKAVFS